MGGFYDENGSQIMGDPSPGQRVYDSMGYELDPATGQRKAGFDPIKCLCAMGKVCASGKCLQCGVVKKDATVQPANSATEAVPQQTMSSTASSESSDAESQK